VAIFITIKAFATEFIYFHFFTITCTAACLGLFLIGIYCFLDNNILLFALLFADQSLCLASFSINQWQEHVGFDSNNTDLYSVGNEPNNIIDSRSSWITIPASAICSAFVRIRLHITSLLCSMSFSSSGAVEALFFLPNRVTHVCP